MTDAISMHGWALNRDGIEREYFLRAPDGIELSARVVYAVHGYTSTATDFEANPNVDDNCYVAVYPQGSHYVVNCPEMRNE